MTETEVDLSTCTILLAAAAVEAERKRPFGEGPIDGCWVSSYSRGEGVPSEGLCPSGHELLAGTTNCYPSCTDRMVANGLRCYSSCPDGWNQNLNYCLKPDG